MWSGPRNMSTTMMRSFGARTDTACVDEPFYAAYLDAEDLTHPMQDEIMASQPADPAEVARNMSRGDVGAPIQYQKQMTHHFLARFPHDWLAEIDAHVFLTRHPARVIPSYARKMETLSLEAIGFPQQARIYGEVEARTGKPPLVIDSDDILANPGGMMKTLCAALGLPWDAGMLSWPAGPSPYDGAWAPHWYDAVNASTGFGAAPGPLPQLEGVQAEVLADALPIYERLSKARLAA